MTDELFNRLKKELKLAVTKHYKIINEMLKSNDFYGYALYTSDDVSNIGAVANVSSNIPVDNNDDMYNYYRYSPDEWSEWDNFEIFDTVNKIIEAIYCLPNVKFNKVKKNILSISLEVMKELDKEGLFGLKNDERFLVIWISDSENNIMNTSAKQLNTNKVYREYAEEFED